MNVVVLGASNKPDRYSCKAVKLLAEKGHRPFPVKGSFLLRGQVSRFNISTACFIIRFALRSAFSLCPKPNPITQHQSIPNVDC